MSTTNYVESKNVNNPNRDLWKAFGMWIQAERERADKTQEQIAKETGLHVKTISRLENGESGSKRNTVIALAKAVGTNTNEALERAGYAPEQTSKATFNVSLDENVRLSLFHGARYTEAEQEEFVEAFNVAYEIAKRRVEEKRKVSQE